MAPANTRCRWIAMLIGRLELTTPQARKEFARLLKKAPSPQSKWRMADENDLDSYLKDVIKRHTGDENTLMFDTKSMTRQCKT